MDALLGPLDDLGRGQADAVIDDVHAGVGGPHRDLLGAVGMAVEARLADQEFQPPAELQRHPLDVGAHVVEVGRLLPGERLTPVGARYSPKAARNAAPHSPVVTPALAAAIEGAMMLAPLARRRAQVVERRRDRVLVARRAPGLAAAPPARPRHGAR